MTDEYKTAEDYWFEYSNHETQEITQANFKQAIRSCQKETSSELIEVLKELIPIAEQFSDNYPVSATVLRVKQVIKEAKALLV